MNSLPGSKLMTFEDFVRIQTRRTFLRDCAGGVGMIAFSQLLALEGLAEPAGPERNPMAVKQPHFLPKAKNVIYLFMAGAPSQLDLYDPKPEMHRWHGQPVPESMMKDLNDTLIRTTARVMASPRTF